MNRLILSGAVALMCIVQASWAQTIAEMQMNEAGYFPPPTLSVSGRGEVSASPDRALVRVGAVVQAPEAAAAQNQVNQIVQRAVEALKGQGIAEEALTTAGLMLTPVYAQRGENQPPDEGRVVAYRASNSIRVRVDDLKRVGTVIDAAVAAGANHVEGISFELKDDREPRRRALQDAAREAQTKAETLAEAMNVKLERVAEILEGGVELFPPRLEMGRMALAAGQAPTPVQPGQVQVQATVTVRYRIVPVEARGLRR